MDNQIRQQKSGGRPVVRQSFEKRWNIAIDIDAVRNRFIVRIWNGLNQKFDLMVKNQPFVDFWSALRHVADGLGEAYYQYKGFASYLDINDFYELLHALELLYEGLPPHYAKDLESVILHAISLSEIDLGVRWKSGHFRPSGAKLLDKYLIDDSLKWLEEKSYLNVLKPFEKGLQDYLGAVQNPARLADVVTDIYESAESMAKIVCKNNRDLSANKEKFINILKLSPHFRKILSDYIDYGCEYRHGVQEATEKNPLKPNEVEGFIYMTGLFIRLAIRQLESN